MEITKISHVSEFIQIIEENNSKYQRNQHFLYRGEPKLKYKLLPSLFRKTDSKPEKEVYISKNSEIKILKEFMTEAASHISNLSIDDMFRWVQYAQHFGVPTRLMDWSSNPLVALFFACNKHQKEDGRVYILNSVGYRLLAEEKNHMDGKIIKEEVGKMIWDSEDTFSYPVLFKPYYFDRRMSAQSSQFMVWGYKNKALDELINELEKGGKKRELIRDEIFPGAISNPSEEVEVLSAIQIGGKNKEQLQRELDCIGINHATLFPGLDGIGKAIEWRNRLTETR